jgi:hypothetical protein
MMRIAIALSAAALALVAALPASGAELTCGDLADLVVRNSNSCSDSDSSATPDAFDAGLGTGAIFGVNDVVAGLLGLGGPRYQGQVACVSGLVRNRADAYVGALAEELTNCVEQNPSQSAYVPILNAIVRLCPSPS